MAKEFSFEEAIGAPKEDKEKKSFSFQDAVKQPAAPFSFKDIGLAFGQGLTGATQDITSVAGATNPLAQGLGSLQQSAGEAMTPERRAEIQRRQQIEKAAEGNTWEEIKAKLGGVSEAPLQTAATVAGGILPYVAGTLAVPEVAIPAMVARLTGLGMSAKVAQKVASAVPVTAIGGVMGLGGQKSQDYETVKRELLEKGVKEEEAEILAQKASEYSLKNLPRQAASTAAGALEGALGAESLLSRVGKKPMQFQGKPVNLPEPTWREAIAKSTIGEALPEGVQSAVGTAGTNVALTEAGIPTDISKGVLSSAVRDTLIGGLMGTAVSPLKMRELRQEYVGNEIEAQKEYQKQQDEAIAEAQKKIDEQLATTKNPLGFFTTNELGPDLSKTIEQHRADTGKPPLTSYALEDVMDALPGIDKPKELESLNALIAAKTNYTGETYTPTQVIELAQEKNVDTSAPSFEDFLSRTTGISDPMQMSQPQLHAAVTSLNKLPGFAAAQALPEGTNATRYTPEQFTQAIDSLNAKMDALGKDDLNFKETTESIETATGLKGSAVNALLNDANRNGNVVTEGKKVSVPSRTTPSGYTIKENLGTSQNVAESYDIMRGDEKLFTAPDEKSATDLVAKLERTTGLELQKVESDLKALDTKTAKSEDDLNRLTIEGKFGTPEYKEAEAKHQQLLDEAMPAIAELTAKKESYSTPLSVAPIGTKRVTPKSYQVLKGQDVYTTTEDRAAAEQAIFQDLSDADLQDLSKKPSPALQQRVNAEIQRRAALPVTGAPATAATPEQQVKLDQLKVELPALLNKFGLKDVGLKIVDAINGGADGSYQAKLIQIALSAKEPITTLRHEAIHALKELGFFTPQQWAALERQAEKEWVNKYLKNVMVKVEGQTMSRYDAYANGVKNAKGEYVVKPLSQEALLEEAIADAFADFDVNKAPPGMLTALLNKLRNFFAALRNRLNGAGFQTYEDVFGKVERGELKAPATKLANAEEKTEQVELKKSLIRAAEPNETEISTRNPQGVKRTNDPITEMLSIDEAAVREAMKANPDMYKRTIQAIKGYGFVPNNTAPNDVINVFKRNIISNLLYLYNKVPADIRERSKLWYDGANRIATDMSKEYKVSMEQVAGIMAAMSPQKDWFQNVSMAERALDILTEQGNKAWDSNMLKYAESYVKEATSRKEREKRQAAYDKIKGVARAGTTLNDMTQDDAAAFIRAYDEAYNSRQYRIVTPEGGFGDYVRKNDGEPATMMWSTYDPIKKTVSIFRDGSRKNISEQLGEEHKIRSFYNNIAAPNSDIGHVTIDTHAVAAGLFEALAGTDQEVIHNFGGTGKNINLGVGGTYGIIADAYREAAQQKKIRAREMQSITWEAVRGLFGENIKSTIKPKIRAEWTKYKTGEQSFDETREKVMKIAGGIDNPDWVGTGTGDFVSDGGTSYDKAFTPEGGVRLREEKDIREKLTFNLSAVTSSIPGLRELYQRAMGRDKEAYTVLQKVAESSLKFLLSGTGAKVNVEYAKGVYLSDREPSISVGVSFSEKEMNDVMAGLAKFAESYNQQQIHVRQETAQKFGHDFGDGSYATAVYEIDLKKALNNEAISRVIDDSGLQGFTITDQKLTAYFVRTEGNEQENFKSFGERIKRVHELVGDSSSRPRRTIERLYVYGEGYGARIPYSEVAYPSSDIRTKQESDTVTPKLIAEYLTKSPVTTFKQKPLSTKQVKEQKKLSKAFDAMPINDLKNPLVKRAYTALANSLKEQYQVMPIKVELMETIDEPYANSDAVRRDVSVNNRFKVYATSPETFGPPGSNFKNHPLLKDSGLKDVNGKPMLYNDLLRAVHDYFAHNLTETQFGPNGEAAAWRNHMAITPDPFARWALTSETRAQNAWQNFRPEAKGLSLIERGFADQKAALPPLEFVMTGDSKIDQPVTELKEVLTPEQQRGSVPVEAKYSLKSFYRSPEAAENAAYKKAPPTTPEFKQWFGSSKIVEEGRPQVMYHASPAEFNTFFDYKPIFISPDPKESEFFGRFHYYGDERAKKPIRIYPLWVRAENSFDFENPKHVDQVHNALVKEIGEDFITEQNRQRLASGDWSYVEDESVQKAIKDAGFDSFYVQEGDTKNLAVFNANQVKSVTGNSGEFGETKDMRFSLRNVQDEVDSLPNGAAINSSINRITTAREQEGFFDRIMNAFKPQSVDALRQQFLNRYNQLGVYDRLLAEKMGGAALLADSSAESAALMSDNAAAIAAMACGIEGKGGIPVYNKGYTTISQANGEKGVLEILMPLAKIGDPRIYQTYQFWAGSKRGSRLLSTGKDYTYTPADLAYAAELEKKYPEFKQVQADWIKYNNGLMKYAVDTGVLSPERAAEFMKYSDYIPFYRQIDGETTVGPKLFQNISGVTPPKKLTGIKEGQEAPLADFLETIVRNTQSIVQSGMKNVAAQRAIGTALQLNTAQKRNDVSYAPGVVTVLERGKPVSYDVADQLFIDAVKSLNLPELPFLSIFSAPANLLRNMVTKDPGFMMANLMRDSLSAWVTSGANMTPIASTISNFGKAIGGKDPAYIALRNAGVIGGYEFVGDIKNSGAVLGKALRRESGTEQGAEKVLKPFTSLWRGLEKGTEASDAATRMAIYKDVMERTGNEAEAIYRAMEVLNFNRKGNLAIVRILTAAVPFLNARMQGLDVLYRAAFGKMASADAAAIQRSFFIRGATIMALSSMYWFLTHDDDEYLKQEQETRDNNWLFPSAGIRIPIPFEVGVLFKVIPERILEYTFGNDTGKDLADSMKRNLINTFAFNPIPQTVLPLVEARTNYSFFTMRPIVGQGMEGVASEYQVAPGTSEFAKKIGKATGNSPIMIDHILQGYTGAMGMYAVDLIDSILMSNNDSPQVAKRFEQMPIIKRFALDREAKGTVTSYYELKNSVDEVVRTVNLMEKTGNGEELGAYMEKNAQLFGMRGYISSVEKQMKGLREAAVQIRSSGMSSEEKRDSLMAITQAQNAMTASIRQLKKSIEQ